MSLSSYQETLITAQVDGPTLTAAAAASCIPPAAKLTLPANFFSAVGKSLRIKASGKISTVITSPGTVRYDVRIGGTVLFDGLAILPDTVAAHVNVGWRLEITLTCRSIGAAATLMGDGLWTCEDILGVPGTAPKGVLSAILPWNSTPAVSGNTFDSTAAQTVDLFFTQTLATGSHTLQQYTLESLN